MPGNSPTGSERRAFVRVRPAADYDVQVAFSTDGLVWMSLQLLDLSLGGLGLIASEELSDKRQGDELDVRLSLPSGEPCSVKVIVRHIGEIGIGVCGVEFVDLNRSDRSRIERVVTELLERGNLA